MKNLILITFLVVGLFAKAQQPELIENTWYLEKLIIDDDEFFPPNNNELHYIPATFHTGIMQTNVCNWFEGNIEFNDNDNTFINTMGSWAVSMAECNIPENTTFENRYFYEFWSINHAEIPDPFHYEIIVGNNTMQLIITNSLGSKAYYNNSQLSTSDLSSSPDSFHLVFQNEELIVKGFESVAKSVSIYDLSGKLVLNAEIKNGKISTNKLPKGIYIVKITDEKGKVFSRKIRKN